AMMASGRAAAFVMDDNILINNAEKNEQTTDEEDPYAAYVIPDDLMW
ncbi:DUF2058 family protein, partial [Acinetobacter baumannii]